MTEQDQSSEQPDLEQPQEPEDGPEPRLPDPELAAVQRARFSPDAEADPDDPAVN